MAGYIDTKRTCSVAGVVVLLLAAHTLMGRLQAAPVSGVNPASGELRLYQTELFGRKYRLDDKAELSAYIDSLDKQIERSVSEEELEKEYRNDPIHHRLPDNFVNKKMRKAMALTRECAQELAGASAADPGRERLLLDLETMAGAIRASYLRVLPGDMDVFEAMGKETALRHPPVGLGRAGIATDLSRTTSDPSMADPEAPSSYWTKPTDVEHQDLYFGFGRSALPNIGGIVFTYKGPKLTPGTHPGFDVTSDEYGDVRLKLGKEYSQPFAQRIYWALGFNTVPFDYVPVVKVKWDSKIFTEFNARKNETFSVKLAGVIPVHTEHLQHHFDPLQSVSEVIMLNDQEKEVSVRPDPDWTSFKKKLYKNSAGRPETIENNFNEAFSSRIKYLVYRDVNIKNPEDDMKKHYDFLGNWDLSGEGNPGMRENRGFAFLSAWLNMFDANPINTKLYLTEHKKAASGITKRTFLHAVSDVGNCLGRADDARKMDSELPNDFPWSFTRPGKQGDTAIPLDGSYHPIQKNLAFESADIYDAKWIARYMAQLTGRQILEALVASGMPSAQVRLYYNKLVHRRNTALTDLGLAYPPIAQMDTDENFNYDPRRDGLISVEIRNNKIVTAPDDDWLVVHGRAFTRKQVKDGVPERPPAGLRSADSWLREPGPNYW